MDQNQLDALQGGHKVGKIVKSGKPITASSYKILLIVEDSVISVFTDTTDIDQIALWGISGDTIKAGTILFCHNYKGIKALTFTSGSGFVYGTIA